MESDVFGRLSKRLRFETVRGQTIIFSQNVELILENPLQMGRKGLIFVN